MPNCIVPKWYRYSVCLIICLLCCYAGSGQIGTDSTIEESDSTIQLTVNNNRQDLSDFHADYLGPLSSLDSMGKQQVQTNLYQPYSYLEQVLNGQLSGVQMLRNSGEPGVAPNLLLRGISIPFGKSASLYENQPLYVVNGIPLLQNNNPYASIVNAMNITDGVGSGIRINSALDLDNIASIDVLKGPEAVALYGIQASNGVIIIHSQLPTKGPYTISMGLYGGMALASTVVYKDNFLPVNANYERDLQLIFYNRYADAQLWAGFPHYLSDSTNAAYYGPADWYKSYYRNGLQHGLDFSISGGTDRANFKFGVAERTEGGVADKTGLQRYSIFYDMYMVPVIGLNIHTYVQANIARRDRNRTLRERYAAQEYIPDQQNPLPVNNKYLSTYDSYLDESLDKNGASGIQAAVQASYEILTNLSVHGDYTYEYNDNYRDYFSPSTLSDGNSFVSYFTGINRRISANDYLLYNPKLDKNHTLRIQLGQSVWYDNLKYDYTKGYRGPSDYIKVIEISNGGSGENTHDPRFVYTYKDYLKQNLVAFYGNASYDYKDKYHVAVSLRNDGSSYFGNGYWWRLSSIGSFSWNLDKESWWKAGAAVKNFSLNLAGGRTALPLPTDYFGYGPYYTVDIGWTGNGSISSYGTMPALGMPFSAGLTGGGIRMPYTDQWSAGVSFELWNVLDGSVTYYNKTGKDLLIDMPVDRASGFNTKVVNGMSIRNAGIELSLRAQANISKVFHWTSSLSWTHNSNKLVNLSDGLSSLDYGDNHLELGSAVDQFYIFQNEGIYASDDAVPVDANGVKLSYNGIAFRRGDPIWKDVNKDNVIDDRDRILTGHKIAPDFGCWNNHFQYKNWGFDFTFQYSFGNSILDANVANNLNIAGLGEKSDAAINAVKEQTFWMGRNDLDKYPLFNPWSLVNAYQSDQSLFLEKGSYAKLQSVSLDYDLCGLDFAKKKKIKKLIVYGTASNLFRISPYSGLYPELSGSSGYDYGYAFPLPLTITFGIKATF